MLKKNIILYKVMITILQLWKLSTSPLIFMSMQENYNLFININILKIFLFPVSKVTILDKNNNIQKPYNTGNPFLYHFSFYLCRCFILQ